MDSLISRQTTNLSNYTGENSALMRNSFPEDLWSDAGLEDWAYGFWSKARLEIVRSELLKRKVSAILDVGAGNGRLMSGPLNQSGIEVSCVEPSAEGAKSITKLGIRVMNYSFEEAPISDNSVEVIGLFDVLEYSPSPIEFLSRAYSKLKTGGLIVATLPSQNWLWSSYDVRVGNLRRYSRREAREEFEKAGFTIEKCASFFGFLLPAAFLTRVVPDFLRVFRSSDEIAIGVARIPAVLEKVLVKFALFEYSRDVPVGLSLIVIATKPELDTSK